MITSILLDDLHNVKWAQKLLNLNHPASIAHKNLRKHRSIFIRNFNYTIKAIIDEKSKGNMENYLS